MKTRSPVSQSHQRSQDLDGLSSPSTELPTLTDERSGEPPSVDQTASRWGNAAAVDMLHSSSPTTTVSPGTQDSSGESTANDRSSKGSEEAGGSAPGNGAGGVFDPAPSVEELRSRVDGLIEAYDSQREQTMAWVREDTGMNIRDDVDSTDAWSDFIQFGDLDREKFMKDWYPNDAYAEQSDQGWRVRSKARPCLEGVLLGLQKFGDAKSFDELERRTGSWVKNNDPQNMAEEILQATTKLQGDVEGLERVLDARKRGKEIARAVEGFVVVAQCAELYLSFCSMTMRFASQAAAGSLGAGDVGKTLVDGNNKKIAGKTSKTLALDEGEQEGLAYDQGNLFKNLEAIADLEAQAELADTGFPSVARLVKSIDSQREKIDLMVAKLKSRQAELEQ